MRFQAYTVLGGGLAVMLLAGCAASRLPLPPVGVSLQPGKFVQEYYLAPGFAPEQPTYALGPFTVENSRGVGPGNFIPLLQEELTRAWKANGLKLAGKQPACRLAVTIHRISISGRGWRFIKGRISASLTASGVITCRGRIVFAFVDRLSLSSPVNPGPPAPGETELLLRSLSRELAHHLLNELLLHRLTAEARYKSANTLSSSRGRLLAVVIR